MYYHFSKKKHQRIFFIPASAKNRNLAVSQTQPLSSNVKSLFKLFKGTATRILLTCEFIKSRGEIFKEINAVHRKVNFGRFNIVVILLLIISENRYKNIKCIVQL